NANTYSGGTIIKDGTVQVTTGSLGGASSVGTGTVTLDGGTFKSGAANLSFSNNFVINSTGGTIDNSNKRLTLTGIISDGTGTPAQLQIIGGHKGVTILTNNNNNYSGGTLVSGTTLQLKANNAAGTGAITLDDAVFQAGAANLKIANNFQINNTPD